MDPFRILDPFEPENIGALAEGKDGGNVGDLLCRPRGQALEGYLFDEASTPISPGPIYLETYKPPSNRSDTRMRALRLLGFTRTSSWEVGIGFLVMTLSTGDSRIVTFTSRSSREW